MLSHGGLSTSFSRQLGQNLAGNCSFTFNLEVSGKLMKRSHFELNFLQENGIEDKIIEVNAFNLPIIEDEHLSIIIFIAWHLCWRIVFICKQ